MYLCCGFSIIGEPLNKNFDEHESNEELYFYSIRPILDLVFNQGVVTIFAYGQTGSGKTFTMNGI